MLAQIGEFAFVLLSRASNLHLIEIANENWSKIKPIIMEEWSETRDELVDLFGKVRDEWIENELTTWIGANRFYPGVSDALKFASSQLYIVTTKQAPGLAVVIVGHRKDSQSYVTMKRKACAEVGIKFIDIDLPEQIPEAELTAKVDELNADPDVHGILVQLPLPKHINEEEVLTEICIEKDVDGFHPLNIGKLAMKGRDPLFLPCTPKLTGNIHEVEGHNRMLDRMGTLWIHQEVSSLELWINSRRYVYLYAVL